MPESRSRTTKTKLEATEIRPHSLPRPKAASSEQTVNSRQSSLLRPGEETETREQQDVTTRQQPGNQSPREIRLLTYAEQKLGNSDNRNSSPISIPLWYYPAKYSDPCSFWKVIFIRKVFCWFVWITFDTLPFRGLNNTTFTNNASPLLWLSIDTLKAQAFPLLPRVP